LGGVLCGMSVNLWRMEEGELCHNPCMGLLLEARMQDIGTTKPNVRGAIAQALDLSPGFGDWEMVKVN